MAAATLPFFVLLPGGETPPLIQSPRALLVLTLAGVGYACMLLLDPRQPLARAAWVWGAPLGLAATPVLLALGDGLVSVLGVVGTLLAGTLLVALWLFIYLLIFAVPVFIVYGTMFALSKLAGRMRRGRRSRR